MCLARNARKVRSAFSLRRPSWRIKSPCSSRAVNPAKSVFGDQGLTTRDNRNESSLYYFSSIPLRNSSARSACAAFREERNSRAIRMRCRNLAYCQALQYLRSGGVSGPGALNRILQPRGPIPYFPAPGTFKTRRGRVSMQLGCFLHRMCMWNCVKPLDIDKIRTFWYSHFSQFGEFFCQPFRENTFSKNTSQTRKRKS